MEIDTDLDDHLDECADAEDSNFWIRVLVNGDTPLFRALVLVCLEARFGVHRLLGHFTAFDELSDRDQTSRRILEH